MNKTSLTAVLFLSFLCLTLTFSAVVQAQTQVPTVVGVKAGDTFKYSFTITWRSTNPNASVPTSLYVLNHTEYYQVNILAVSAPAVTVQTVSVLTIGDAENHTYPFVVGLPGSIPNTSSDTSAPYLAVPYSAGLGNGDPLFPGNSSLPWTVNMTLPRFYGTTARDTNLVSVNRTDIPNFAYSAMDVYFDKATGMVVDLTITAATTGTFQETSTYHYKLIETNVWVIPQPTETPEPSNSEPSTSEQPTSSPTQTANNNPSSEEFDPLLIVLIAIIVAVPIGAFIVLRGGKSKQPKPTEPKAQATAEAAPAAKPAPAKQAAPAKLICSKCGKENPVGSEFCNKCGNRLQE
jgi:hypothetical protein